MRKAKLCWQGPYNVRLWQLGRDNFAVQYGMQVDEFLSYDEACAKMGQAIMHALACEGQIDNAESSRHTAGNGSQRFVDTFDAKPYAS